MRKDRMFGCCVDKTGVFNFMGQERADDLRLQVLR